MTATPPMPNRPSSTSASCTLGRSREYFMSSQKAQTKTESWSAGSSVRFWSKGRYRSLCRGRLLMAATMSDYAAAYRSKLRTPEQAAELVPARGNLSMGMGVAMPPALTRTVADRARAGDIEDIRLYYMHPTPDAQDTILAMEVTATIKPHPFYIGPIERALVQRQKEVGRRVVYYVPGYFHQVALIMIEDIGIDAHMVTVSPMDRNG